MSSDYARRFVEWQRQRRQSESQRFRCQKCRRTDCELIELQGGFSCLSCYATWLQQEGVIHKRLTNEPVHHSYAEVAS